MQITTHYMEDLKEHSAPPPAVRHMGHGSLLLSVALGLALPAALTACATNSSSPCDVVSKMDSTEIQITGPKVHGCDTAAYKEVNALTYLGLLGAAPHMPLQYEAPAPSGTPVCTVTSRDQTWRFYDAGGPGGASGLCKLLKDKTFLHLWQSVVEQQGN